MYIMWYGICYVTPDYFNNFENNITNNNSNLLSNNTINKNYYLIYFRDPITILGLALFILFI
jgi:hypothetical protein